MTINNELLARLLRTTKSLNLIRQEKENPLADSHSCHTSFVEFIACGKFIQTYRKKEEV